MGFPAFFPTNSGIVGGFGGYQKTQNGNVSTSFYIHAWDDQCCLVLIGSRNQFGDSIVLSLSPLDSSENCWDCWDVVTLQGGFMQLSSIHASKDPPRWTACLPRSQGIP